MHTLIGLMLFMVHFSVHAVTGEKLDRTGFIQTFNAEFNEPGGSALDTKKWKTNYYFGTQLTKTWPNGSPVTMAQQSSSRMITGERQVYIDKEYCGRSPFWIGNGFLYLYSFKSDPIAKATCGQGTRDYMSGLITTEKSFSQTHGYFEMRARLPSSSGTWPAFWLLPTVKTPENLGRLPEIDIFEHWGGDYTVMSQGKPFVIKRKGKIVSTIHEGTKNLEYATSNRTAPPTVDVNAFHVFGMLWTPTEAIFYLDGIETYRTSFINDDPHYMLINVAISDTAGDPALGVYPTYMMIDYVRAYKVNP